MLEAVKPRNNLIFELENLRRGEMTKKFDKFVIQYWLNLGTGHVKNLGSRENFSSIIEDLIGI